MSGVRSAIWLFPSFPAGELVEFAVRAQAAGIDELWLGDEGPARDPFVLLGAVAARTRTLRLGLAVTSPYLRLPAVTAAAGVTLAELSGDRFVLGFGTGGGYALDPVGIRPRTPFADTERALLTARAVAERRSIEGYDPPAHAVGPRALPLVVGSRGERLNRFASAHADGAFLGGIPISLLGRVADWVRSVRPIDVSIILNVALDEAERERRRPGLVRTLIDAPAHVREHVGLERTELRAAQAALEHGDEGPARGLIDDAVLSEYIVSGTPSEIAGRVRDLTAQHRPASIGFSLLGADPGVDLAAAADILARALASHGTAA